MTRIEDIMEQIKAAEVIVNAARSERQKLITPLEDAAERLYRASGERVDWLSPTFQYKRDSSTDYTEELYLYFHIGDPYRGHGNRSQCELPAEWFNDVDATVERLTRETAERERAERAEEAAHLRARAAKLESQ